MRVCDRCAVEEGQEHQPFCAYRSRAFSFGKALKPTWIEKPTEWGTPKPPLGSKPVWLRLEEAAATSKAKDAEYGESYLTFGAFAAGLFPDGLKLETAADWGRFACLFEVIQKVHRYAQSLHKGGHADSLIDISVYAQMLARLDDFERNAS